MRKNKTLRNIEDGNFLALKYRRIEESIKPKMDSDNKIIVLIHIPFPYH